MSRKDKKITLLISSLAGGGSERICVNIANSFVKNGWKVDLVVLSIKNEVYANYLSDNINIFNLKINKARYSIFGLLKYIYKKKPRVLLVFNGELSLLLVILRILLRFKIKILFRNNIIKSYSYKFLKKENFLKFYMLKVLEKYLYPKLDHVINQCYSMQEDLNKTYPQLKNNSSVIFNPVSQNIINYVNKSNITKIKKENYLLCVGRLEKQKAFDFAIEGFAGIADKFPNLRLKIVGKGSLELDLKQKAINCGIEERIDFEGFQRDIIPYYLYAKATILTSLYEGYPNVLIESIAMNTPVVAFDCPCGPSEIINEGSNGYLVKYQDINDLKKKISDLLINKFTYKNLENSIKKNQINYIFKNYENLINSLY